MSGTGGYFARVKITVIQGLRLLGYEPEKFLDWALGRHVREKYVAAGRLPPLKDNASKTFAGGNYCLCYYDPEWLLPVIAEFMDEWNKDSEQQLDLFEEFLSKGGVEPQLYFPPEPDGDLRPGVELDCPLCHAPLIFPRDEGPLCQECGWPTKIGGF